MQNSYVISRSMLILSSLLILRTTMADARDCSIRPILICLLLFKIIFTVRMNKKGPQRSASQRTQTAHHRLHVQRPRRHHASVPQETTDNCRCESCCTSGETGVISKEDLFPVWPQRAPNLFLSYHQEGTVGMHQYQLKDPAAGSTAEGCEESENAGGE